MLSISVVTPNFNHGRYLRAAIDSIVGQNYPKLEYVIVDGGSTDDSVEIIKSYADRLAWWVSEKDAGIADAINKGFAHTRGEIMAWLGADDMYVPWTFRIVSEIFEAFPDVDWIKGYHLDWSDKGALGIMYDLTPQHHRCNRFDYLLPGNYVFIQQESMFWRRRLWEKVGNKLSVDARWPLAFDTELFGRFFQHARLTHVETVLGGARVHRDRRCLRGWDDYQQQADAFRRDALAHCPARERRWAKAYQWLRRQRWIPTGVSRVILRALGNDLYRAAAYDVIRYDWWSGGQWQRRQEPVILRCR